MFKSRLDLGFFINPFFLYCLSFTLAIFLYLWGWSDIFPELSSGLIFFLIISFIIFTYSGYNLVSNNFKSDDTRIPADYKTDVIFWLIALLGIINVLMMGYLPVLDRSHDYREFGIGIIDPVFNTLSIFFSVVFLQTFLGNRKSRYLIYFFAILTFQILLFRRSTIIWIFTSSSFLLLLHYRKISLIFILTSILCIPPLSYCFGLYGNTRSNLTKSMILDDLKAGRSFLKTGMSQNHYITYLYVSSPLANLQKNIDEGEGFFNRGDIKRFIFYSLIPESFTIRLEKAINLIRPECSLITYQLITGTFFMISFYLFGWIGMITMLLFLFVFIIICLRITKQWSTFRITAYTLLCTTVSLLIFSNFMNRLDVILMLFIYPVLFHFIYSRGKIIAR